MSINSSQSQGEDGINLRSMKINHATMIRRQYRTQKIRNRRMAKHYQRSSMNSHNLINQKGPEENHSSLKVMILDKGCQTLIKQLVKRDINVTHLSIITQQLQSQVFQLQLTGIVSLRILLLAKQPPFSQVLQQGIDIFVINLIEHQNIQMRYEASWCLLNITCGDDQQCQTLVQKGALPILLNLFNDHLEIIKNALWALSNMACDCKSLKMKIISQKGIQKMIFVAQKYQDNQLIIQVCEAFSNICRGERKNDIKPPSFNLVKDAVLFICCMITCGHLDQDYDTLKGCLYTIADYFEGDQLKDNDIQLLLQTNLLVKLMPYLVSQRWEIRQAALRTIGNLESGRFKITEKFIELNICDYMIDCLKNTKQFIRRQACWFLSNFAIDGIQSTCNILQNIPLLQKLFQLFVEDSQDIKKQVLYVFANISQNCADYVIQEIYIEAGIFQQIVQLLKSQNNSNVQSFLQNLYNLLVRSERRDRQIMIVEQLNKYQGLDLISYLRNTECSRVNYQAEKIYLRFLSDLEEN